VQSRSPIAVLWGGDHLGKLVGFANLCANSIAMPRPPIDDEFKDLSVSRQRKYQLRKQRDNRCTECGRPVEAEGMIRCLRHLVRAREQSRKKNKPRRRYYNTLSYRLQAQKPKRSKRTRLSA